LANEKSQRIADSITEIRVPLVKIASADSLKDSIGHEIAVSDWIVVTQERINEFAKATGDQQWIHLDRDRAEKESPYGTTIAHGFLTLSLLSLLMQDAIQFEQPVRHAINYGLNRVRFPSAVRAGSRIRARFAIAAYKDLGNAVELVLSVTVDCEGSDKPACIAEWVVRHYR
jgi:acyl dehydratase